MVFLTSSNVVLKRYTHKEGREQTRANIAYYKENARIIKEGLESIGLTVYGGVDAPYIWLKTPGNMTSWELFDILLEKVQIVSTPRLWLWPSW